MEINKDMAKKPNPPVVEEVTKVVVEDSVLDGENHYFTVNDVEYRIRKLGLRDCTVWGKIIKNAAGNGYEDLSSLTNFVQILSLQGKEMTLATGALLFGLVDLSDPIFTWIASVLERKEDGSTLTLEDIYDPEQFEPDSLITLAVEFLMNRQLQSFFVQLVAVHKNLLQELNRLMESLVQQVK